jgi:hypothetical protein
MDDTQKQDSQGRQFTIDMQRCIVNTCDGELTEQSYYERNNWITVEYACTRCGKEFTVKVEH